MIRQTHSDHFIIRIKDQDKLKPFLYRGGGKFVGADAGSTSSELFPLRKLGPDANLNLPPNPYVLVKEQCDSDYYQSVRVLNSTADAAFTQMCVKNDGVNFYYHTNLGYRFSDLRNKFTIYNNEGLLSTIFSRHKHRSLSLLSDLSLLDAERVLKYGLL